MSDNWRATIKSGIGAAVVFFIIQSGYAGTVHGQVDLGPPLTQEVGKHPDRLTVILERIYLDGEISEEVVKERVWSMAEFWAKYDQWQLADRDGAKFVFKKQVDDISPLLKVNGYFGINGKGILTIYFGKPDESKIIQSFFQIDMKKLESTKQAELRKGIPIKTKDRYVEVLETFKAYSVNEGKLDK
jgi:forespore regulator of the sigma-K checkpoint